MVESARLPEVIHYDVPKPETKIIHKTKVIKKPVPVVHYVDYPVKKEPPRNARALVSEWLQTGTRRANRRW